MDIVFVIDASGSVGPVNYLVVLNFVGRIVGQFSIDNGDVRVGILVFGSTASIAFHLNRYSTLLEVQDAVSQLADVGGQTVTAPAFRIVRDWMFQSENGSRETARHVVVCISDGNTDDPDNATTEVTDRRHSRAVNADDIDSDITSSKFRSIAIDTGDTFFGGVAVDYRR